MTITGNASGVIKLRNLTITGDLIVNTPQATVNNEATVNGTIDIQEVATGTWNENANGNNIRVNDSTGITLNIGPGIIVKSLILNQPATLSVPADASFTNPVAINAESKIISERAIPVIIKIGVEVTIKADKDDVGQVVTGDGTETDLIVTPDIPVAPVLTMEKESLKVDTQEKIANTNGKIGSVFDTELGKLIKVSLKKGTVDYSNVRILVEGGDDGIQLIAQDTAGDWYDIVKTGWGPEAGFQIADATTAVYVVANQPGTFNLTVKLVDAKNNNEVLAKATGTVIATSNEEAKIYRVTPKLALYNGERVGISFQIDAIKEDLNGKMDATNDLKVTLLDGSDKVIATNTLITETSLDRTTMYNGTSTTFYDNREGKNFHSWNLGVHEGAEALNSVKKVKVEYTIGHTRFSKTFAVTLPDFE